MTVSVPGASRDIIISTSVAERKRKRTIVLFLFTITVTICGSTSLSYIAILLTSDFESLVAIKSNTFRTVRSNHYLNLANCLISATLVMYQPMCKKCNSNSNSISDSIDININSAGRIGKYVSHHFTPHSGFANRIIIVPIAV